MQYTNNPEQHYSNKNLLINYTFHDPSLVNWKIVVNSIDFKYPNQQGKHKHYPINVL